MIACLKPYGSFTCKIFKEIASAKKYYGDIEDRDIGSEEATTSNTERDTPFSSNPIMIE